ncbi:hypothetical protein ACTOB_003945 [Actinoplanes oblitus]|uniref:Uncharacterized protein n=1 Tax=Actinoplanes oblitus TaxID=3040509 RepID=A0ABY8WQR0_9ACTN|nr:hypothetical protein [Actinoplanes oblitus]WIN00250.1 hypothetical protein ACTOB_003945 [Actinoplanes oblitus]
MSRLHQPCPVRAASPAAQHCYPAYYERDTEPDGRDTEQQVTITQHHHPSHHERGTDPDGPGAEQQPEGGEQARTEQHGDREQGRSCGG